MVLDRPYDSYFDQKMEEWYDDPWSHLSQDDIEDACLKALGSRTQNCGKCSFNENGYCYQKDRQVEKHWGCLEFEAPKEKTWQTQIKSVNCMP